jgi:hypothetical protein
VGDVTAPTRERGRSSGSVTGKRPAGTTPAGDSSGARGPVACGFVIISWRAHSGKRREGELGRVASRRVRGGLYGFNGGRTNEPKWGRMDGRSGSRRRRRRASVLINADATCASCGSWGRPWRSSWIILLDLLRGEQARSNNLSPGLI